MDRVLISLAVSVLAGLLPVLAGRLASLWEPPLAEQRHRGELAEELKRRWAS